MFLKKSSPDLIVAIGGGSVLDYAKIANVLTSSQNLQEEISKSITLIRSKSFSTFREIVLKKSVSS